MKQSLLITVHIVLFMAFFCGCVAEKQVKAERRLPVDTSPDLIDYQIRALDHESNNELQLALLNWRIAESLLYEKISDLTDRIENNAEKHFQKGLTLFNKGNIEQARHEFLKTLRYDRENKEALKFLKGWLNAPGSIDYSVKKGDTFQSIAGHVYKNKRYDFIVQYFSGCSANTDLDQGMMISLPILETEFTKIFFNAKKELLYARNLYNAKDFLNLIPVAQNILKHIPDSEEAQYMINSSFYGLGESYFKEGRYKEATHMLKKVDPRFRDVSRLLSQINAAEEQELAETTENKNSDYYRQGRQLFNEGHYLEAKSVLVNVTPDYADVQDLLIRLKTVMKQKSELHYREGVKYFVSENLEKAIEEWNSALLLDPDNQKIKRDIDNANALIDKIKTLE